MGIAMVKVAYPGSGFCTRHDEMRFPIWSGGTDAGEANLPFTHRGEPRQSEPIHCTRNRADNVCKDGKGQMTDAEDFFKAFDGIELPEFVEHQRTALEGHCCCLHVFSILLQTTVLAQLGPSSMCSLSFDIAWINAYAIMQMNGTLAQCFILMARIWELLELLLPNCSDHTIDQLDALHYSRNSLESWSLKFMKEFLLKDMKVAYDPLKIWCWYGRRMRWSTTG